MKHPPIFRRGFPPVARHPKLIRRVQLWTQLSASGSTKIVAGNQSILVGLESTVVGLIAALRVAQRFAARLSGLAFGLALAVRPAGSAGVCRVNGALQARPAWRDAKHR
jgi:hypothetical protein